MATLLLIVIYAAFISLGLPDSLFGTAWPAIYSEFNLPISASALVTVTVSCCTVVSSLFSARVIRRFGTGKVSFVSTLLTALAMAGFALAPNLGTMMLLALPLGLGAGAVDAALNNYVALHYSATHMSFLHCFYGVGVSISPYILSLVITGAGGWRGGYRIVCLLQLAIALLLGMTLPLWGRGKPTATRGEGEKVRALSLGQTLKIPGVKVMGLLFFTSCAIEGTCGAWASTYLVEFKHVGVDTAAGIVTFYYVGMTLGRFLSGVLANRLHPWQIIRLGMGVLAVALVVLLLPGSGALCGLGLFLVGLGNGPLYPNFSYLTPDNFGAEVSQSVIGVQMTFASLASMATPTLCGLLGQQWGMGIYPWYMLAFFLPMVPAARWARVHLKGGR